MVSYSNLSSATLLLVHIFNPDIFFAIVSCCSHGEIGVFVPPVQLLDVVGWSPSRLMTVFTNALSMADILLLYPVAEIVRTFGYVKYPTVTVGQV